MGIGGYLVWVWEGRVRGTSDESGLWVFVVFVVFVWYLCIF